MSHYKQVLYYKLILFQKKTIAESLHRMDLQKLEVASHSLVIPMVIVDGLLKIQLRKSWEDLHQCLMF